MEHSSVSSSSRCAETVKHTFGVSSRQHNTSHLSHRNALLDYYPLRWGNRRSCALGVLLLVALFVRIRHEQATIRSTYYSQHKTTHFQSSHDATINSETRHKEKIQPTFPSESPFFAACLMIMDDNHRLPEWFAYHYHMLPLRYLVVLVDPRSQTTPDTIVQRWRDHTDMKIHVWNGTEPYWRFSPFSSVDIESDPNQLRSKYVERQLLFYDACTRHLQDEFQTKEDQPQKPQPTQLWTAYWDIDEFLFFNHQNWGPHAAREARPPGSVLQFLLSNPVQEWYVASSKVPHERKSNLETPLHPNPYHLFQPCMVVPRVTLSAVENHNIADDSHLHNNHNDVLPDWISPKQMETLRWRYYEHEYRMLLSSWWGKSMLDVLHPLTVEYVQHKQYEFGVHKVLQQEYCSPVPARADAAFLLHHYIGSWEWYSARTTDSRRGTVEHSRKAWEMVSQVADAALDTAVQSAWLYGFVESMGETKARLLLQGAGVILKNAENVTAVDWNVSTASQFDFLYPNN